MNRGDGPNDNIDEGPHAFSAQGEHEDLSLIERTATGDEAAFFQLYQRHHLPLFNYLLRLVQEAPVAEDLLQEAFLAVWRGAGKFRGQSKVKTWIFRIGHNQAVSWLRKLRPAEQDPVFIPEEDPLPEAQAHETWRAEQVWRAMERLSSTHRAVVELAYMQSFSYPEIAQILDCPVGTVKSRMSYALRYLGAALRELGVQDEAR